MRFGLRWAAPTFPEASAPSVALLPFLSDPLLSGPPAQHAQECQPECDMRNRLGLRYGGG